MQTNDPYWPLIPGELTLTVLEPFLPLSFQQLSAAFQYELITLDSLKELVSHPGSTVSEPSVLLLTFLRTASVFDRTRDVQEELDRLSSSEQQVRPPLWKVLATLIVRRPIDEVTKMYALESLYQTFGRPTELRPYTLYGDVGKPPMGAPAVIDELRKVLDKEWV